MKGGNRSKYTCELYITNWSYSNKLGIVFTMYQIMRSKGESWAGPRITLLATERDGIIASFKLEHTKDGIRGIRSLPGDQGYEDSQLIQTVALSLTNTLPTLTLQVWVGKCNKE